MPRMRTGALATIVLAGALAAPCRAAEVVSLKPVSVAVGFKAGAIPPVLAAPELMLHLRHVLLGVFGVALPGGMLRGAAQYSIGLQLGYEFAEPGSNTPYLLGTMFHYGATKDASGRYERGDMGAVTAGYEWKWSRLELQLGGGALIPISEERDPCTGWFCSWPTPPVLPALELSLRFGL